jgi:hypothetical protein
MKTGEVVFGLVGDGYFWEKIPWHIGFESGFTGFRGLQRTSSFLA